MDSECNKLIEDFFNKKSIKITPNRNINRSKIYKDLDYLSIKNNEILEQAINDLFENINTTADYEIKETHQFTMILPKLQILLTFNLKIIIKKLLKKLMNILINYSLYLILENTCGIH